MTSEVEICNLALANLGDTATVASLSPPEGSAQAEHCARFYPAARDTLLSLHPWAFATVRERLSPLATEETFDWRFCYASPANCLRALAVLPVSGDRGQAREFVMAAIPESGEAAVFTNEEEASLLFVRRVTDTGRFPPVFVTALSWQLAASLAGPLIKGSEGAQVGAQCLQMASLYAAQAATVDARMQHVRPSFVAPWMAHFGR